VAFDTVDHDVMLCRLRVYSYGLTGVLFQWFTSYLLGRIHGMPAVAQLNHWSSTVLGPILFIVYTTDLIPLIEQHGLAPHLYANDIQIIGSSPQSLSLLGSLSCRIGQLDVIKPAPNQHIEHGTDVVFLTRASPPCADR